jgi:PAS domain S-box-containing protein
MKPINILIVDDREENIIALAALLNRNDICIYSTTSANEALKIAWANNISIALLDVQMPEMDGFELASMLKSNPKTKDIFVIFVTAISKESKYAIKGFGAGAIDYIYKPLDPFITTAKVDAFIQLAKSQIEIKAKNDALENYAILVNNSADIICTIDAHTLRIKTINPAVEKVLGFNSEELLKKNIADLAAEEDRQEFRKKISEVVNKNLSFAVFELRFRRFDGQQIWVECRASYHNKLLFLNINDISPQKSYLAELLRSKHYAEQAKKIKEIFLANMSHELRTPVNGIVGLLNLLKNTPLDKDQKEILNLMSISSDSLLDIINDVLDISKMEAGKLRINRSNLKIKDLINNSFQLLKSRADDRNIKFILEIADDVPDHIWGDGLRVKQILMNLLSNAIKFTELGHVTLAISVEDREDNKVKLRFSVEDTGIGISKESISRIFNSFEQADDTITSKYGGTGLGLNIVRNLIELKGGELAVSSEPGNGSTFVFSNWYNLVTASEPEKVYQVVSKSLKSFKGKKLLIVEDNSINQFMLSRMLQNWETEVDIVENGQLAIEKLAQNHYDLILMDTHMPVMNGYEAAKIIRLDFEEPKRSIPILSLSATTIENDQQQAFNAGMNAVLCKPFKPEDLHRKINELLKE